MGPLILPSTCGTGIQRQVLLIRTPRCWCTTTNRSFKKGRSGSDKRSSVNPPGRVRASFYPPPLPKVL